MELGAQTFFSLWWWEELLQLLYGFSDFLLVAGVVSQGDTEHLAHLAQVLDREVEVLVSSAGWSTERRLQSERVDQLEFFPHDDPTSSFLWLLNLEVTVIKVEMITVLVEEQREDPFF